MMNTKQYLEQFTDKPPNWAKQLEQYAKENRVPIIDSVSMKFLLQLIQMTKPENILEIGTAIGYSALRMHDVATEANIITVEKNEQIVQVAKNNISQYAKNNNIKIITGDALEIIERFPIEELFDFVFIDAAKSQYNNYFSAIDPLLKKGGLIVADNVLFRNFVTEKDEQLIPKRYRTMVRNLKQFNERMMNIDSYHSTIVPLGDGLLISIKIK